MTTTEQSAAARAITGGREAAAERRARHWRWAFWGEQPVTLLLASMVLILLLQPQPSPHIIEVDPEGRVLWMGPAGSWTVKDIWVATQVKERWITNSRRRGEDKVLMGEMRTIAEEMTTGEALRELKAYHHATNPELHPELKRNPMRVTLQDFVIMKQTTTHLEIHWHECWKPTFGKHASRLRVVGEFTVEQRLIPGPFGRLVMRAYDANRSPLGVYVVRYHLTEAWEKEPATCASSSVSSPSS